MQRLLPLLFFSLVAAVSRGYCEDLPKVGAALYLNTDVAPQAQAFREGLELGFAAEGAADLVVDSVKSPKDSVLAATKFISADRAVAIVLNGQPDAIPVAAVVERAKVPAIVLWDANEEIDKTGQFVFSLGLWTEESGRVSAQFAKNTLQANSAAIIAPEDIWGKAVAAAFRAEFERLGGAIVYSTTVDPNEGTFLDALTRVRASKPDVIYESVYLNVPAFFKRMRRGGVAVPIITSDVLSEDLVKESPPAYENAYQSAVPFPDGEAYSRLAALYEKRFGRKPAYPWFTAVAFDAATLLSRGIKEAGPAPERISDWLYSVKGFRGASSTITISSAGSSPQYPAMYRVNGTRLDPASKP